MTLSSLNPANGTLLRSYDALGAEAIAAKIGDAQRAFRQYRETPLDDRVMWLKKLAGILEHEMEELATLLTMEVGKTIAASRNEILDCAACCRYYAENAVALLEYETSENHANRGKTVWQPKGVLFALMPCSSPFWQVFRFAVPALLGGNAVVLKHSPHVPQCALEMDLLVRRAGFARGVFQTLLMNVTDVEAVLDDERVAVVAVAGAQKTTREIAAHTTWLGKKAVTQPAGDHAFIVLPSANLFAAIQAGVAARCLDNGQSHTSASRFLVHASVYDDFAMLFASAMEDVKVGNPLKDETELGPLATPQAVDRLKAQVARLIAAGGGALTGGEVMLGAGNYFEPTVMVDVPHDAEVNREALHGPVAVLYRVESLHAAIALANGAAGLLGASVWTQDAGEQEMLFRQLECGSVWMNAPTATDARMVSSGMPSTGHELANAKAFVREFVVAKTLVIAEAEPEQDFHFDLTLDDFEQDREAAKAVQPEETAEYEPMNEEELSLEADVFVKSQETRGEATEPAGMQPVATQTSVVLLDEAESEEDVWMVEAPAVEIGVSPVVEPAPSATVDATPAPPVLSFAEMFERALQARG